jgi:hypothetical protein
MLSIVDCVANRSNERGIALVFVLSNSDVLASCEILLWGDPRRRVCRIGFDEGFRGSAVGV